MILQIIKNICNNAYKQIDGEKCTIIIDELDIETFNKCNDYIDM